MNDIQNNNHPQDLTIIDILEKNKDITPQLAEKIRVTHLASGEPEEIILKREASVSEEKLVKAKSELIDTPFVDLEKVGFSPISLTLVPRSVAERYQLVPFDYKEKENLLSVAMVNPLDLETIEFLEKKTGKKIKVFISTSKEINEKIAQRYQQDLSKQVSQALEETTKKKKLPELENLEEIIKEAPVAKVVSTILEFAIRSRASDVHLEPREEDTKVRYRIDGILQEKLILPRNVHEAVVSRIKILSDLKIDEKRIPQDGRFNFTADGQEVDLRVSTVPTIFGEKVVMRLLKKQAKIPTLPELGLRGKSLNNLEEAISRPHGIIIVCGPTGSGKTTTLYSVLSKISTPQVNVVTIEDPVEYQMEGVNQVQVNPQAGLTFASALRSFLRQDPNIVMVGEIRDKETTELAINASLTGHLVFSTLHTNNASGAPPRLIDMGGEPFLLVSSLTCVVAQRVLRTICGDCKEEFVPPAEVQEDIKKVLGNLVSAVNQGQTNGQLKLYHGKGCQSCGNTGYRGRIGIFEAIPVTEKIGRLIIERASSSDIEKQAIEEGLITMKQDGYLKALEGITTIEEVLRVAEY